MYFHMMNLMLLEFYFKKKDKWHRTGLFSTVQFHWAREPRLCSDLRGGHYSSLLQRITHTHSPVPSFSLWRSNPVSIIEQEVSSMDCRFQGSAVAPEMGNRLRFQLGLQLSLPLHAAWWGVWSCCSWTWEWQWQALSEEKLPGTVCVFFLIVASSIQQQRGWYNLTVFMPLLTVTENNSLPCTFHVKQNLIWNGMRGAGGWRCKRD